MPFRTPKLLFPIVLGSFVLSLCASCTHSVGKPHSVVTDGVVVSVRDQKLAVMKRGKIVKTYPVSTSKFGVGDRKGSCKTPLGQHCVSSKVGDNQPKGMVFKSCCPTGEVVAPNSPGRDPIVTRILCLNGEESWNRNANSRRIYIHGTAEENMIGRPASYGCIRMKSDDILEMYPYVSKGDPVAIELCSLSAATDAADEYIKGLDQGKLIQPPQTVVATKSTEIAQENRVSSPAKVKSKKAKRNKKDLLARNSSRCSKRGISSRKRKGAGNRNQLAYTGKSSGKNRS
ncbi:MAG: L,D-transpeptidase [Akkermansia sp.]